MSSSRSRAKRGAFVAALAGTAALAVPGVAGASLQAGAPVTKTTGLDMQSAAIVPGLNNTVEICTDGIVDNASLNPASFVAQGYEWFWQIPASNARTVSSGDPSSCQVGKGILLEFTDPILGGLPASLLGDFTSIAYNGGGVLDDQNHGMVPGVVPLTGSFRTPIPGASVGPQLVSVTKQVGLNNLTFNYNRPILTDSAPLPWGVDINPANFYFETASGNTGVLPGLNLIGSGLAKGVQGIADGVTGDIVGQSATSVTVHFPTAAAGGASVADAKRVVADAGAVVAAAEPTASSLDVVTLGTGAAAGTTQRPDLISAKPVAGQPWVYDLQYDTAVTTLDGVLTPLILAINEEGLPLPGLATARPGNDATKVRVQFLPGILAGSGLLDIDSADRQVVRIVDLGGGVIDFGGLAEFSSPASIALRTMNQKAGFTSAPDLTGVKVDRASDQAKYAFDEMPRSIVPGILGPLSGILQFSLVQEDTSINLPNELFLPALLGNLLGRTDDSLILQYTHDQALNANGGAMSPLSVFDSLLLPATNLNTETTGETVDAAAAPVAPAAPAAPAGKPTTTSSTARPVSTVTQQSTKAKRTVSGRLYRTKKGNYASLRVRGDAGSQKVRVTVYNAKGQTIKSVTKTVQVGNRVVVRGLPKAARRIKLALV